MIRMGTLSISSKEKLKPILAKHQISHSDIIEYQEHMFIMIENNKITGLSVYDRLNEDTAVIFLMAYDIDFINKEYRDGFFRGTVNFLHQRGYTKGVILTHQENNAFYKGYDFNTYESQDILNKYRKYNDFIEAYAFKILEFFNRPCKI